MIEEDERRTDGVNCQSDTYPPGGVSLARFTQPTPGANALERQSCPPPRKLDMNGLASVYTMLCSVLSNSLSAVNNLASASNRVTSILDEGAQIYQEEVRSEREARALARLTAPQ